MKFDERLEKIKNGRLTDVPKNIKELAECLSFIKDKFLEVENQFNTLYEQQSKINEQQNDTNDKTQKQITDMLELVTKVAKEDRAYLSEIAEEINRINDNNEELKNIVLELASKLRSIVTKTPNLEIEDDEEPLSPSGEELFTDIQQPTDKAIEIYLKTHNFFTVTKMASETGITYTNLTTKKVPQLLSDGKIRFTGKKHDGRKVYESLIIDKGKNEEKRL